MIRSCFLGTGSYLPPRIVKNDDLKTMMDTSDEWIRQRTGIEERRWVDSTTTTSDLAVIAAERALESAKVSKNEIDMVVFATVSPDHEFPGTGCFFQAKLGIPAGIPVLDIKQQCSGFIYGISIADQFIKSGMYKKILVIGAEVQSKGLDRSTFGRDIGVLFGDGAGAVVIGATEVSKNTDSQIFSTHLHADGNFAKELWIQAPGMTYEGDRIQLSALERKENYPRMNGKTVFVHAVRRMPEAIQEALQASQVSMDEVDLFVFHQANLRINEMIGKSLGIPEHKIFNTIQKFGNTTAATIPIGLDEAVKAGKLKKGMLVASAAFGSGFTWGSALFRW